MPNDPHQMTQQELLQKLQHLDEQYHSLGKPTVSDASYDTMREVFRERFPNHPYNHAIGAKPSTRKEVLPYFMPSLDKIKPHTPKCDNFFERNPADTTYCVSAKIDGISLLAIYDGSRNHPKLYTRGDGINGQNVSILAPHLRLPRCDVAIAVRLEAAMDLATFNRIWSKTALGKDGFANDRNMLAGMFNRIEPHPGLAQVQCLAHELIYPGGKSPSAQFKFLEKLKFSVVPHTLLVDPQDSELTDLLAKYKRQAFAVDGLVIAPDHPYVRTVANNPSYVVAFKDNAAVPSTVATVREVVWEPSKNGKLKPRLRIPPTVVGGVTVEFLTGFNAWFVEHGYNYSQRDSGLSKLPLGPGAVIKFVRSGDVIPHVQQVVKGADSPQMPSVGYYYGPNDVEIYAADENDSTVAVKKLAHFFASVGVENLAAKQLEKLYDHGYDTIFAIVRMTGADWLRLPGVQSVLATKLSGAIKDRVSKATLAQLGDGSGLFGEGIGTRKLSLLFGAIPDVLTLPITHSLQQRMLEIGGFSEKTVAAIVAGLPDFVVFLKKLRLPLTQHAAVQSARLAGVVVVFTQVRDKQLEEAIVANGGSVSGAVSGTTTHLVTVPNPSKSEKLNKAQQLGVTITTIPEFRKNFGVVTSTTTTT